MNKGTETTNAKGRQQQVTGEAQAGSSKPKGDQGKKSNAKASKAADVDAKDAGMCGFLLSVCTLSPPSLSRPSTRPLETNGSSLGDLNDWCRLTPLPSCPLSQSRSVSVCALRSSPRVRYPSPPPSCTHDGHAHAHAHVHTNTCIYTILVLAQRSSTCGDGRMTGQTGNSRKCGRPTC